LYKYRVVFAGELVEGFAHNQVTHAVVKSFGISDEAKLERLFSGMALTLQKNLEHSQAKRFRAQMADLGMLCRLEVESLAHGPQVERPPPRKPPSALEQPSEIPQKIGDATPVELTLVPMGTEEPIEPSPALDPELELPADSPFHARDLRTRSAQAASSALVTTGPPPREPEVQRVSRPVAVNSSGQGGGVALPPGINGLSWGGFFLSWLWAIFNNTWVGLLALLPVINVFVVFLLLFEGRKWAWQNKRWRSVEHFNRVQRRWSIAGVVLAAAGCVVGALVYQTL
jgi:hypothetical protein